ncbi:hypothetical protein BG60_10755 [Caballeronia zhejiangensis]|uniref:Uncharacterized protein n=2 Tax=Burkholderiaceae TaxID=119060 RepID=A0A656QHM5_9BURK|nr:hypothetical protein [Caballeronia sp. CLC5]KDR28433.1 hypothetical protein BG60_10755 [Caballeronia zhejiangensis]MCE4575665.1 hypothetical protein [Caballeronia sp. CLC5]
MRNILAALLTAAAAMPSFASETPSLPDPTDAAAPVPSVMVPAIAGSYQSFQDKPVGPWSELNNAVAPTPKKTGPAGMSGVGEMDHSTMPSSTAVTKASKGAVRGDEKSQKGRNGMAGMSPSEMPAKSATDGNTGSTRDNKKEHSNHEGMHE